MVDHPQALLPQPKTVGLALPEVSPLAGVFDEPQDAVVVNLAGPRRVDAPLSGNAVRAPGGVVVSETLHVVAQLTQRGRTPGAGQPAPDHDHGEPAPVQR